MKKMRFLSLLLVFCMGMACLPIDVYAAMQDANIYWEAVEPEYNYNIMAYEIHTPEELQFLGSSGSFRHDYVLCNDLDLSGKKWSPQSFYGTLDGQGHTIKGINADSNSLFCYEYSGNVKTILSDIILDISGSNPVSLVDKNQENMTIKNCKVTGSIVVRLDEEERASLADVFSFQYGSIAKKNYGTIENCDNFANISIFCGRVKDEHHGQMDIEVGGIVGDNEGSVTGCKNYGKISLQTTYEIDRDSNKYSCLENVSIGGIVAKMSDANDIISGCSNFGNICFDAVGSDEWIGGIVAVCSHRNGSVTISDCVNQGKIEIDSASFDSVKIGGIVGGTWYSYGEKPDVRIERCTNKGTVDSPYFASGIFGYDFGYYNITLVGCANEGNILSEDNACGIIGSVAENAQIIDCVNKGIIQGVESAAGITWYNEGTISNCVNLTAVTGGHNERWGDSSGIASFNDTTGKILHCGNAGCISGLGSVAGIAEENQGIIDNSYNTGIIQNTNTNTNGWRMAAGIAADNRENGKISNCCVKQATISSTGYVSVLGGICATNDGAISNCFAKQATISSVKCDELGGICAGNSGEISDCYFQGVLRSESEFSLITAICETGDSATVKGCYGVASVNAPSGNNNIYGLAYWLDVAPVSTCYSNIPDNWDNESTLMTVSQMQDSAFVAELDTLSGQTEARGVWKSGDPYPELTGIEATYTQPVADTSSFGDYYATMEKRTIRVFLQDVGYTKDGPIVTVSVDDLDSVFYGNWGGGSSDVRIEVPNDYDGNITISCEGYLQQTLPADLIGNFNQIKLWKASENGRPVLQSVFLDKTKGGYKSFSNLISGTTTLSLYENSTDIYSIYIDVEWGANADHSIKLMQGSKEIAMLSEGWNRNLMLGQLLESSGGNIYISLGNGAATKSISVKVYEEVPIHVGIDMGDTQEATMPEDMDAIGGKKLKVDLKDLVTTPMNLEISEDGTVKGTIGVSVKSGHTNWAYGAIKEAFQSWKYDAPLDQEINNLITELNKSGELDSATGQFGITTDIQLLGYCEGKLDWTGKIHFTECGVIISIGGKVSYIQQAILPVISIPYYFETSFSTKVALTFHTELIDNHLSFDNVPVEAKIAITVGAGVGVPKYISGGMRGKGELSISACIPYTANAAEWKVSATGSFVGCLLGMDGEWEVWNTDPPWIIYKDGTWFPSAEANAVQLLSLSQDELTMASREYLSDSSEFLANNFISAYAANSADPLLVVKNNVYTYANPQLAVFSDNTKLLVWLDDTGVASRPLDSNRTALYYSYFDGESWSEPELVCEDDGKADFNPLLKCIDNTAYLVWNKADAPFESDDISLNDISLAMGISYAKFDRETRSFIDQSSLTIADDGADFMPDITLVNGIPTVVWANNSVGDFLFSAGESMLKKAVWAENQWSVEDLTVDVSNIDSLAVREMNGELEIYYSKDVDGDISDQSDRELFCYRNSGVDQITSNGVPDSSVVMASDKIMWYQNGELFADGESATTIAGDDYQYVTGSDGQAAILYCKHTEDSSSLCCKVNDGFGWSNEVLIANVQGFVYAYSGAFSADGSLSVAVTQWDENKVSDLVIYDVLPSCDLGITYADYDMYTLIPGKTINLTANVENAGMSTVSALKVSVKDGENEIYSGTLGETIRAGEEKAVDIPCTLPNVLPSALTLTVSPVGTADYNKKNNSFECKLRTSDVSIEHMSAITTGKTSTVFVQVANRGTSKLEGITITVHLGSASGTILWTDVIDSILPGSNVDLSFSTDNSLPQGEALYAVIDPIENENILNNNKNFCSIQDLTAPTYILGDVNEDGAINTIDAMQVVNHFVGNEELMGNRLLAADVNGDGVVNTIDAMLIVNFFVGNIDQF